MEDKALFATRQLAKRQYTWLRSLQEIHDFKTYLTIKQAKETCETLMDKAKFAHCLLYFS